MEINVATEVADTVVALAGKYGKWLNIKGDKLCFIIWAFCILYWIVRKFDLALYSQTISSVFSMGFNLYGYFYWRSKGIGNKGGNNHVKHLH